VTFKDLKKRVNLQLPQQQSTFLEDYRVNHFWI